MNFRLFLIAVLLLLDILLLPPVLNMPYYIKISGFKPGIERWKQDLLDKPLSGPVILFNNKQVRYSWCWAVRFSAFLPAKGESEGGKVMARAGRRLREKGSLARRDGKPTKR